MLLWQLVWPLIDLSQLSREKSWRTIKDCYSLWVSANYHILLNISRQRWKKGGWVDNNQSPIRGGLTIMMWAIRHWHSHTGLGRGARNEKVGLRLSGAALPYKQHTEHLSIVSSGAARIVKVGMWSILGSLIWRQDWWEDSAGHTEVILAVDR